ncbi:MAG: TonB-dependent receptor, partial [Desulfobacteraceae bacterium]
MIKRTIFLAFLAAVLTAALPVSGMCDDSAYPEEVHDMGRIDFTAKGGKVTPEPVSVDPQKSTIHLDDYKSATIPQNAGDLVKELVIMDHRGATDLVPDDDTLYMRGFSSKRFTTALDGSAIRKTGGRRSSHIVDYALIPPFMIDSIEVLPGPHSALYPGKSIGGTVNFRTKDPKRHDTRKPDAAVSTSYGTYGTQNHSLSLAGSAGDFVYDLGYQNYATDGYLRNNEADINTFYSRLSYLLENKGHVSFTASYTDADRQIPVNNDPDDPESGFDNDYPFVSEASRFYDWQNPTWDKIATSYRLNLELPTSAGTWNASAFYGKENRDYSMMESETEDGSWETKWHQQGGKITNEFSLAKDHVTIVGAAVEQLFDGYGDVPGWDDSEWAHDDKKRIETLAGFAEHEWSILPDLTLTAGLRYEDDTIWVSNHSSSSGTIYITGQGMWIERNYSEWIPKSFITYDLDDHAAWLRDTSVSAGVSKIWRAP